MSSSTAQRIVSDESEHLVLVDEYDRPCGTAAKSVCHDGAGLLHRAFSVFVFDADGRVLVQQRSGEKRLWPLAWSTSCCSHPRPGEPMQNAAHRRLEEELGINCECHFAYKFKYQVEYRDLGAEHEFCWVYLARCKGKVRGNETEVADWSFMTRDEVDSSLRDNPDRYTPWFAMQWPRVRAQHLSMLNRI